MTKQNVRILTYLILGMIFIFPCALVFGTWNAIYNHIFAVLVAVLYAHNGKINKRTFYFWILIAFVAIYTGRYGFIDMIIVPILGEYINNKDEIKKVVYKSHVPYVCILFTLVYSVLYRYLGIGGRGEEGISGGLLYTGIGEVNLTGIAIFGLGLICRKKNKFIGNGVLLLGLLTISRSYILAIACVILFNFGFVKKVIEKIVNKLTYMNLTILSSFGVFALGIVFVSLYQTGGILAYNSNAGFDRLFHLNDYSNYYRFLAIYLIVMIMYKNPQTLLLGFSNEEFMEYGRQITSAANIDFGIGIGAHNLFFSHLKMYGLAVFFEIYYVSKYLKRVINHNNFGIFFAIFLYCIILGTGLSSFWLYFSAIILILYQEPRRKSKNESLNKYYHEYIQRANRND